jgi:plastocyanin
MKMHWATAGLAVMVGAVTFAACGDDSGSSEPAALTVVASEPADGEYAFDVPAEMEGGTVSITLDNSGAAEAHEIGFVQVEDGTDPQEFADQVLASEEGAPIPDFVLNAPGGVGGAAPGTTRTSTVEFEDGTYVYFCTFGGEEEGSVPHYQAGMLGEVTVSGTASTAALPAASGTITASEYQFEAEGLTTGEQTIEFTNSGEQFHHLIALPMAEGAAEAGAPAPGPAPLPNQAGGR